MLPNKRMKLFEYAHIKIAMVFLLDHNTTTDKLELTDWSQVNRMNSWGENAIFQ